MNNNIEFRLDVTRASPMQRALRIHDKQRCFDMCPEACPQCPTWFCDKVQRVMPVTFGIEAGRS